MTPMAQQLALAVEHHNAGRLAEAEVIYRSVLREAPQQPHALHLLGVLLHQAQRPQEAVDLIRQALAVHGPHPVFHSNLATVYLALGRPAEAEAQCREALRLQANLPDAHHNRGVALRRLGRLEEAEAEFREALRLNPGLIDARCNLGAVLQQEGMLPEALSLLQDAVRRAPAHAQAHNDLGGTLIGCGRPEEAARHLREALRLRPDFAEAYNNLGVALRDQDEIGAAVDCFHEALRRNPRYAAAYNNLGYTREIQGEFDQALAEYQQSLRLDPLYARSLAALSRLAAAGHYRLTDDEVRHIRELAARDGMPADDRYRLHFALAWSADEAGAHGEAFEHCRRANELRKELYRRRGIVFDLAAERRRIDRLIDAFSTAYFERVRSFGVESELPIFIVGMLRSGTTLAEQILASHPRVHGAGELQDMNLLVSSLSQQLGTNVEYPECTARLDAATAQALAEQYIHGLRQRGGEAERVIDKLPFNFLHLGVIATLFPRARIIHCRRDPADTCVSCFFQNLADPPAFLLNLQHLGQYYREYERLMAHWARVLPVPIFELRYEDLTADQETTTRRLLAFCGLEWDERCLAFSATRRVVRTASTLQVRKPLYRSSVGRWKRYEAELQLLLEELK